jgi:hypothetical protein
MEPEESKRLYLLSKLEGGIPLEVGTNRITIKISWRRGNATWFPQVPVNLWIDMPTIQQFSIDKRR